MIIKQYALWAFLLLMGLCTTLSPHDATAQTNTDRQAAKRIYVGMVFDSALSSTSSSPRAVYPLHGRGLAQFTERLKQTTTAALPKGPQGGIELSFVAVIAKNGKIVSEWTSHPVRVEEGSIQGYIDSSGIGEMGSPWEAFDKAIEGFQEPLVGLHEPFLAFGKPIQADAFVYDERQPAQPLGIPDVILRTREAAAGDDYVLILTVESPRDAASYPISVQPAVIPFSIYEAVR